MNNFFCLVAISDCFHGNDSMSSENYKIQCVNIFKQWAYY